MPGAGYEVRGNGEMFPLNGPCWSLFFEYIGNILYALFIRRLSNKALAVLTILLGVALASFAIFDVSGYGNMGVGWTLDGINFGGGLLRMLFPFSMGMLLSRNFKPIKVKGAFWICTIALVALFSVPYLEGATPVCTNGIYEAFCVIIAFPVLVWLGASGTTTDKKVDPDMQVPGRYILSSLCDTLSIYVLVLCMAHQEPALHVGADLAGCLVCLRMEHIIGLSMLEIL